MTLRQFPDQLEGAHPTLPVRVRRYVPETDAAIIGPWWTKRGNMAPLAAFPLVGVIAEYEGIPTACAFLYEDKGGKVGMIEWECTNPEASAIRCLKALHVVFDFFERYAADNGMTYVFSWTAEGRGDGRILRSRKWTKLPGPRHELMCFVNPPSSCPQ